MSTKNLKRAVSNKYEPSFQANEHNVYIEEYFSGPDVRIYLDGQEQYEISQLSFNIQEQIKPIYGYASRLYDEVAIGNRLVVGSFTVPLKNKKENNLNSLKPSFNAYYGGSAMNNYTRPAWVESLKNYDKNHGTVTSKSVQDNTKYGKIKAQGLTQTYRYKAGQQGVEDDALILIGRQLVTLQFLTARDIDSVYTYAYYQAVKAFQKTYLKEASANGVLTPKLANAIEEAASKVAQPVSSNARGGATSGGSSTTSSATTVQQNETDSFFSTSREGLLRRQGYSILVEIGDNEQYLRALVDVRLRSKSVSVDASGNPISEVYEFIARDLRENTESTDKI